MSNFRERLQDLSPAKRALLEKLLRQQAPSQIIAEPIPRLPSDAPKPLSFAEQRLWFVDQLEPDHPFYNLPLAAKLTGNLDHVAFAQAFQDVVDRHETLRSTYRLEGATPYREVNASIKIAPQFVDLRDQEVDQRQLERRLRVESRRPFVLEKGPLIRCTVFQLKQDENVVLLVMHHIVSDGWSMGVMLREITLCYEARLRGATPKLLPLPLQYADFAAWQQERLTGEFLEREVEHWRERLQHTPTLIDLPTSYHRSATQDFEGATTPLEISAELSQSLQKLARQYQATPFMVFVAAYAALLARYARQNTVNIGTAVANRLRPEVESLIGFFVNTLVLPIDVQEGQTFGSLIEHVRDTCTTAFAHQEVPFEKLVEHLVTDRDRSHSPLFQVAFVLQNAPHALNAPPGLKVEPLLVDNGTAKSDLTFFLTETSDGRFIGQVEYRTSLFTPHAIEQMVRSYQSLIASAIQDPNATVAALPLLDARQRELILNGFNHRKTPFTGPRVLHEAVSMQAHDCPDKVALVHHAEELSYRELEQRTNAVAAALQARGVLPGQPVVVALPRSIEQIIASIAILKCGAVYAPMDPEAPEMRCRGILRDIAPQFLIGSADKGDAWQAMVDGLQSITVEELVTSADGLKFKPVTVQPHDLAYMIFTSGSTGTPKGVQIEHRGIVNFLRAKAQAMEQFGSHDRVMHGFSPCFDGSIAEVFMTLMHGATLVIVDREIFIDPPALTSLLNEQAVTVGMFSPTLLSTLDPLAFPKLRIVLSAGEALTPELARRWMPGRAMYNGYGPTEVSIGVSVQHLQEPLGHRVSIGSAMANMRMYLLDAYSQPVPIGVVGEIYIGGASVGRGYLNRPELTEERFLPDPFSDVPGGRMYRTGDLGRWREDGTAEFVSRRDDQIKLRGFRIELGEIESALNALPFVRRSVVVAWGDDSQSRRLVAYIVPDHEQSNEGVQSKLQREQVANWRELFEESHRAAGPKLDREFDIAGWASTYTGRPLPQNEMRAWVDATVSRILRLQPKRVLEIGCGTGLILLNVAPHCQAYVGTDILVSSLAGIEQALQRHPEVQARVRLNEQAADDFSDLESEKFDLIVLNSVAQYFPNAEYLHRVIQQAINHLAPNGKLFLGDLRNHALHAAWATSVELFRAEPETDVAELRRRVATRLEREEELLIDPSVFEAIAKQCGRACVIEVQLKHLHCENELSHYRYDVTLHFDCVTPDVSAVSINASDRRVQPDALREFLESEQPRAVILEGLINVRVHEATLAHQIIQQADSLPDRLAIEKRIAVVKQPAFDPNRYFDLANQLGYHAEITWSSKSPDRFDVRLRHGSQRLHEAVPNSIKAKEIPAHIWEGKTNDPLRWRASQQYISAWRAALNEQLPDYMVPSSFVLLSEIPFTVQGKVDKAALPPPPSDRPEWAGHYVAPREEAEAALVRIWEQLLEVRPIGIRDSFFSLGGHSMLAVRMVAEVQSQTGKTLPLAALFRNPTIEHLAVLLNDPATASQSASLVLLNEETIQTQLPPLFCLHPAGGTVFCYRELAAQFSGVRQVYGLQALGIDGLHAPHETLGEMAAHYVRSIRDVQATGPYHLLGWSIGGVIAFEVARQLQEQGETIGQLVLLDAGLLPGTDSMKDGDFLPLMAALFPGKEALSLEALRQMSMEEQVRYFTERASQAGIVPAGYEQLSGHIFGVFQANVKAVHEYLPQKLRGAITLVRPQEQAKTVDVFDDPVLGWRPYVDEILVRYVPGDHAHMLQAPAVQKVSDTFLAKQAN